jgi:HSP20 family protein
MNGILTARKPWGAMNLRDEMEDMLGRFWGDATQREWMGNITAPLDVAETANAFEVRMDAPGMNVKDFDIQVNGNTVTISGERKEDKEEKGKTFHRVERRHGTFLRTMNLPCNLNADEVAAEYVGGVLTVKLPKAEDARPKKVAVKG